MSPTIVPRDQVAEKLDVPARILVRYEARGLVRSIRVGDVEGYEPAEIRKLWTIVSFQRDLGINLAGVEAVLKLQAHLAAVHRRLDGFTRELRSVLDDEFPRDA